MNWLSVNHTFLVGENGFDLHFRRRHLLENQKPATAPSPAPHPKGSLAKGSWHGVAVTEGFTVGAFSKAQTYVEPCQPEESPRFCQRQNHPPLARGA